MYMAPKFMSTKRRASQESDIWFVAITLLEFLTYENAWDQVLEGMEGNSVMGKLMSAAKASMLPMILDKLGAAHRSNIQLCLKYNKSERPTALQLLLLEW